MSKTVKEILIQYMEENKFDGLFNGECSCKKTDLVLCDEDCSCCTVGVLKDCKKCDDWNGSMCVNLYDFCIGEKEEIQPVTKKPMDFVDIEPWSSFFQSKTHEIIALNVMRILARTKNEFRKLSFDEYISERIKDGNFKPMEEIYFNAVITFFDSYETVKKFSKKWNI